MCRINFWKLKISSNWKLSWIISQFEFRINFRWLKIHFLGSSNLISFPSIFFSGWLQWWRRWFVWWCNELKQQYREQWWTSPWFGDQWVRLQSQPVAESHCKKTSAVCWKFDLGKCNFFKFLIWIRFFDLIGCFWAKYKKQKYSGFFIIIINVMEATVSSI